MMHRLGFTMRNRDNFTDIRLTINTLDVFHFRSKILKTLQSAIPKFRGDFLDVGCGKKPYMPLIVQNPNLGKYIGLDLQNARDYGGAKADIFWTAEGKIPLSNESVQSAMATEVLEHCPDPVAILKEVNRVLAPGSFFFLTVPFIWNLHEVPFDEYRYTPFSLKRMLHDTGFEIVETKAHGGWNAALGLVLALWCRRYWKNNLLKFAFSICLFPLIYLLFKSDNQPVEFSEGQMITGISILAKKL